MRCPQATDGHRPPMTPVRLGVHAVPAGVTVANGNPRPRAPRARHRKPQQTCASQRAPGGRLAYWDRALFGCDDTSGVAAAAAGSVAGFTKELPDGPVCTASCSALPATSWFQVRNHTVHPSSHFPATGLPLIVTGSPGTAM